MITRESQRAPVLRCLIVLAAVTAGISGVLVLLADELGDASQLHAQTLTQLAFDEVLVRGATLVLTACLMWFWLVTLTSCLEAATTLRVGIGPRHWRRLVLVACGLTLAAGISPAMAETSAGQPPRLPSGDQHALAGLPLPDRATTPDPIKVSADNATISVRVGDTLWDLARTRLPAHSTNVEVAAYWHAIWRFNRTTIGSDPDLIQPGTILRLPNPAKEK